MPDTKHYVYSARTTKDGLAVLNKAKGTMSWDQFINDAVCAHYGLDRLAVAPPKKDKAAKEAHDGGQQSPAEGATEGHPAEAGQENQAEETPVKKPGKSGKKGVHKGKK